MAMRKGVGSSRVANFGGCPTAFREWPESGLPAVPEPARWRAALLTWSADVQIHIEVSTTGRSGRQRIATIERSAELPAGEGVGLTLDEVKTLVQRLQAIVATEHVGEIVAANASCGDCGQALARKGLVSIVYRTAFGKLDLACPRLYSRCRCCGARAYGVDSFNPLAMMLAQRTHPELLYLQTRWAASMSSGRAAKLLEDVLPLDAAPPSSSIKAQVRRAGAAMVTEAYESGEHFFDGQPLRFPQPPAGQAEHVLEVDAAYVRGVADKCGGRRSFGIITSRLFTPQGFGGWHAYVIEDTRMALKRLHHFLHRQDVALDTPLAIISDGGEDVAYPSYMPWRPVQRILDWFHIGLRFEHVLQRLRGLSKSEPDAAAALPKRVESAKWRLWHGRAAGCLEQLEAVQEGSSGMLLTRVAELVAYLQRNKARLVHYAQRYRLRLAISTSAAESSVESVVGDRFKKNRKMRWTPKGANALLHIRVADLNGELASALKRRHWTRPKPANDSRWLYAWAA
jgi:hypothetical protein